MVGTRKKKRYTGDFKNHFMQSFSPHMSWDTGDFKNLFMQSFSPHVSWDLQIPLHAKHICIVNVTDFKWPEDEPN